MNLNTIRKEYSKLTPRERLYAVREAALRGDDAEALALAQTAPKVAYSVTHHYFLTEAWTLLAAVYVAEILDRACVFYMAQGVLFLQDDRRYKPKDPGQFDRLFSGVVALAGVVRSKAEAWRVFCENHGADPEKMLAGLPGAGLTAGEEYATIPVFLEAVYALAPGDPDPGIVASHVEALEEAFQTLAGQQSGGWG